MKKSFIVFPIVFITSIVMVSAWIFLNLSDNSNEKTSVPVSYHQSREVFSNGKEFTTKLTVGAIGDILIHNWVYDDAYKANNYNFKPMFQKVKSTLQSPDILLANEESILGGTHLGLSSYPIFNSPQEVGDALKDAGVDIVSTANNHSLDKGERGIESAIRYYEENRMPYVGFFNNKQDQEKLRILNKNGIKIAFLAYSYGTNGIPVPEGKDYLVNLIDKKKMSTEIHKARKVADVVVMSIHWGNEYQRFPTDEQKELAQFLADEGVDIIFGHHPHVLQPMQMLKTKDHRNAFVVYSLGNFLSGQMWDYKDIGGLATIDIIKKVNPNGTKIILINPTFFPTFVANNHFRQYRVVPLKNAAQFGLEDASKMYDEILYHMFQWLR